MVRMSSSVPVCPLRKSMKRLFSRYVCSFLPGYPNIKLMEVFSTTLITRISFRNLECLVHNLHLYSIFPCVYKDMIITCIFPFLYLLPILPKVVPVPGILQRQ